MMCDTVADEIVTIAIFEQGLVRMRVEVGWG